MRQFQTILRNTLFAWLIASEIVLLIIVLNNNKFIDSWSGLLIFFLLIPVLIAILWAAVQAVSVFVGNKLRKNPIDSQNISAVTLSFLLAVLLAVLLFLWLITKQTTSSSGLVMYALFLAVAHIAGIALYKLFKKLFSIILQKKQNVWLTLISLILTALIAVVSLMPSFAGDKAIKGEDKILILGFDGSSWNVLSDMLQKKEMRNFVKLMESGSHGNLRSLYPIYSPFIWNTIASGKSYDKHGVLSFATPSYGVKCNRIWDILEIKDRSIGLCGYYQTWPPWETNGFIIPHHLSLGPETYPPELRFIRELYTEARIQNLSPLTAIKYGFLSLKNGLRLDTMRLIISNIVMTRVVSSAYHDLDTHYKKRILALRIYADVFSYLIKKEVPDLAIFLSQIPDNVSHRYWKFMEPEHFDKVKKENIEKYSGVIHECYREVDKVIDRILENYDDTASVFLVSDHGFEASTMKADGQDSKKYYYISSIKLLELSGLKDKVEALHSSEKVHIRIFDEFMEENDNIQALLKSVVFADSGNQVFEVIELTPGFIQIRVDPDFEDIMDKMIKIKDARIKFSEIYDDSYMESVSGRHAINGVIVMKGPHIKKNHKIVDASILDVTPTMLYLLGLPVGEDMDGKVIEEAIEEGYRSANKVRFIPTHDTVRKAIKIKADKAMSEKMKEELRSLGYIR